MNTAGHGKVDRSSSVTVLGMQVAWRGWHGGVSRQMKASMSKDGWYERVLNTGKP